MIKDLKTYIETVNKSATSSVSGAEDTKVETLRQAILKGSWLLPLLPNITMTGKFTDIPFIHLPDDDDTTFRVGGIQVTKELLAAQAVLVDDTVEDSSPNLETALDRILISQARLKVENYIADQMSAITATAGVASSKSFSTIVELIKKFPNQMLAIEGKFVAVVSPMTHFTILSTMDNAHREMVKSGIITLVPALGMEDDALIMFHTQGVALGYTINGIEKDRDGASQKDNLIVQATAGFGYDSDYIKHVKLS
ncbi:hypothetical protein JAVIER_27 [Vibrio phage Javier]|nr:hypothetical protein DAX_32 [Vibrio phage Dax]QKN85473.1 hypothetical protein DIREPILLOW8_34 [Vibrio phage Direpillow8]QQO89668.1 hypothetical protein GRLPWR_33 [Vibrio phage GRLPWR]QQO89866.1 hypothetical protein ABURR_31 [Vibrio phage ABurr]WBU76646.1 hypothetical protein JAVIER_27 [Vibrio phage Javier]WBU76839.1 hypothetical protein KRONOS_33 [Vibrio phage Kronos]